MAPREIKVVINGEEFVSQAANDAAAGMDGFAGKTKGWFKSFVDLKAGWDMLSGAVSAVTGFVRDSFGALDEYNNSQRKLEGTSKLTGIALKDLRDVAKTGQEAFKLSSVTANEFSSEIGKLTSKAGDIGKSKDAMAAFLDIGAARGLSASETLKAVQQSILGIDEGTDKLFGKNPSAIYKEYADKIGVSVGKLTDQQKIQALLNETLEGGEKVRGSYLKYLDTAQGQQEQLTQRTKDAEIAFAKALQPLRLFALELGTKLAPTLGPVAQFVGGALVAAFANFGIVLSGIFGGVGKVAEEIGKLTGKKDWQEWGSNAVMSSSKIILQLDEIRYTAYDTMLGVQTSMDTSSGAFESLATKAKKSSDGVSEGLNKVKESTKKADEALNQYKVVLEKLPTVLTAASVTDPIEKQRQEFEKVRAEFDRFAKSIEESPPKTVPALKETESQVRNVGDKIAMSARATLDLASAFGIVDDKSRRALENVISIGEGIAKFAAGDKIEGAVQIMGAVSSLLMSVFAGDPARKKLIAENTAQMERLRNELGNLSLDVTGETFAKTQAALGEVMPLLKGGRGQYNQLDVLNAMRRQGLSMADLEKVSKELGVRIYSDSGALSVDGIRMLLEAMNSVEMGMFGKDYTSQSRALTAGFDVKKVDERGQISALFGLGSRFSKVFEGIFDATDLTGSRANLASLFDRFNAGGFKASELGGFTGEQFLSFITDLIGRIDALSGKADGITAGDSGKDIPPPADTTTKGIVGVVEGGIQPETVQAVIKAMDTNVTAVLTTHTALHERIANATEGAYMELQLHTDLLQQLVSATAGRTDGIDKALESTRYALAVQRGIGATY